jgi:beta,beta-carotene 9',10'-dioxygenase
MTVTRELSSKFAPYAVGLTSLKQEVSQQNIPVTGQLPPWLTGTLLRTGPALFAIQNQPYQHWFDGLAMLHHFSFAGDKVMYRNRFLKSDSYREAHFLNEIHRS